jgi:bifunctional non-homologous end joining protein LigD
MAAGRRVQRALSRYHEKRRFDDTPEPKGGAEASVAPGLYVIQKHAATRLHYDFRLELDGVLLSWAVTRGPSFDPREKRLAVRVEDHPVEYGDFEGTIPEGNYGAGTVMLWDRGTWTPVGDPHDGLARGKLEFGLDGEKLKGRWALVRLRTDERRENWLLIKERDAFARDEGDVLDEAPRSVASAREMDEIAVGSKKTRRTTKAPRAKAKGTLPAFVAPALATLVDEPPLGRDWLFEVKFDGYRAEVAASGEHVRVHTRAGHDWTERFPDVAEGARALGLDRALMDGEIVVLDEAGRSDFGLLQKAMKDDLGGFVYFAFDLLALGGEDLSGLPLAERKARLKALLGPGARKGPIFYSEHVARDGRRMLDEMCRRGLEGIIAKRAAAPYRGGRMGNWLKVKCGQAQEFVIVGWRPSTKKDRAFSSILLGLHEKGRLRYAGRVGSGFDGETLDRLSRLFRARAVRTPPVEAPRDVLRDARWVRPDLVAEIAIGGMTRDGLVRQGRFKGLREDKPPSEVKPEKPRKVSEMAKAGTSDEAKVMGVRLTHPDKVLYPDQGVTKLDLALYLEAAAPLIMPHLGNHFVSLVRCPDGRRKQCFFQRHAGAGLTEFWRTKELPDDDRHEAYLYTKDARALILAAQMGALEFHVWGASVDDVERPDRIVLDLDPDPAVPFEEVRKAAADLRDVLKAVGLESYPMLTGGKGVHVIVPLRRRRNWPAVKGFAAAIAARLEAEDPARFVANMSKAKRKGRIFVDYLRNELFASAVAPYSPRARDRAPVAWPLTWEELAKAPSADMMTLERAVDALDRRDPWPGYFTERQELTKAALAAFGVEA